ncbi:sigma-54-dependent transcriptional regulator [Ahrensia marina]|uniref:Fis family transcriptional regulator n=1 Tax=Ahrensia marina TaxID=1514904 RepID=A0A0N0VMD7_9HYPH|nr:sigma-54 dependent transcriptional regulator [Ahrensia marina]KPB02621.1 Fis family transcriptional regulator [Ahrensia marina]
MSETILFVDDEEELLIAASQTLKLADLPVLTFSEAELALNKVARDFPGIVVSDIRMPNMDGMTLLRKVLEIDPALPVILITGNGDVELAVDAMRAGAYDFLEKPYDPAHLIDVVRRALDKRRLTIENRLLRNQVGSRDAIEARLIGRSDVMVRLREQVRAVAATDADILVQGETGTGKEVIARAIHRASSRQTKPFVHINCAALPKDLVESELFGHVSGAFAGAVKSRFGKLEHGRGGTIFLDAVDCLEMNVQAKFLQAIQSRQITPLGSNEVIDLDVRFIAASKEPLDKAVAEERFRDDLYYRLNVVTLYAPPLSARRDDIPQLFMHLVAEAAARYRCPIPEVDSQALSKMATGNWLGNVRELRNAADRYVLGLHAVEEDQVVSDQTLVDRMNAHERAIITATLAANGGALKPTYETLGISRKALYEKMQKHGLDREKFA